MHHLARLVAVLVATGCSSSAQDIPSDAGGTDSQADAPEDRPRDASFDAPPIDWPDASWEKWICEGNFGPCPAERPFCCPGLDKGPRWCESQGDGYKCIEWPNDDTVVVVVGGCADPGIQCPPDHSYCCSGYEQVCATRELEGWPSCQVDE